MAGSTPTVTISAPLVASTAQTWTVSDASQNLNITGALSGNGAINKAGLGTVTLSAAGTSYTGGFTVTAGQASINTATRLSGVVATPGSGSDVTLTGGAFYYNNATSGTLPNDITLNGGTLSAGGNNQTYSGAVNVAANSSINLRDSDSRSVISTAARNVTLRGPSVSVVQGISLIPLIR